ncbi:MAG: hypothetical protein NVS1B16_09210 [Pseudarthrobacter sp.]
MLSCVLYASAILLLAADSPDVRSAGPVVGALTALAFVAVVEVLGRRIFRLLGLSRSVRRPPMSAQVAGGASSAFLTLLSWVAAPVYAAVSLLITVREMYRVRDSPADLAKLGFRAASLGVLPFGPLVLMIFILLGAVAVFVEAVSLASPQSFRPESAFIAMAGVYLAWLVGRGHLVPWGKNVVRGWRLTTVDWLLVIGAFTVAGFLALLFFGPRARG